MLAIFVYFGGQFRKKIEFRIFTILFKYPIMNYHWTSHTADREGKLDTRQRKINTRFKAKESPFLIEIYT